MGPKNQINEPKDCKTHWDKKVAKLVYNFSFFIISDTFQLHMAKWPIVHIRILVSAALIDFFSLTNNIVYNSNKTHDSPSESTVFLVTDELAN